MGNKILELTAKTCSKTNYGKHSVTFADSNRIKYEMVLRDSIPDGTVIKLNTLYHDLYLKREVTVINVKQKFNNNQPEILEFEVIDILEIDDGFILTYKDTTTSEEFKEKIDDTDSKVKAVYSSENAFELRMEEEIGLIKTYNLKERGKIIQCMPHFHKKYLIENWIYSGMTI
jgi:hypothetical protein